MPSIAIRAFVYVCIGVLGEVIFTALKKLWQKHDWTLEGATQLWVFPLYAAAVLGFEPLHDALRPYSFILRGIIYVIIIFIAEGCMGFIAKKLTGKCPWEYTGRWHFNGYINLPHAPFWFALSFIFERLHDYLISLPL